ncbi:MAG: c-type cytochrome [Flavobacteriales bacterium]|nr:c-type cytochrome [Flavobacteriales bacterium]
MLPPLLVLCFAGLVLLWWHAVDGAFRTLGTIGGRAFNERAAKRSTLGVWATVIIVSGIVLLPRSASVPSDALVAPPPPTAARYTADSLWYGPDTAAIAGLDAERASLVRYGRDLIANTAAYLGPQGSVDQRTNGMNCQNCHLDAGTKPWGNNYGAVWSTYPKFRERSGGMESVAKRVNDCVERSLDGHALDSTGREMRAILAYMEWVGTEVPSKVKPKGTGIVDLPYLDRPADPARGARVFTARCMSCHDADGQGKKNADGITYQYPPLWGEHSYNIGAGLYRLSRFAGYVKNNMPQGATHESPQLTDEEAWDVAAYVNAQQRPERDLSADWPRMAGKPVDHPFGPYIDTFTEEQHKFGPFAPIVEANKALRDRKDQQIIK